MKLDTYSKVVFILSMTALVISFGPGYYELVVELTHSEFMHWIVTMPLILMCIAIGGIPFLFLITGILILIISFFVKEPKNIETDLDRYYGC